MLTRRYCTPALIARLTWSTSSRSPGGAAAGAGFGTATSAAIKAARTAGGIQRMGDTWGVGRTIIGPARTIGGSAVQQLTVVGVGLIGGSVGLAAKARGVARRVVGVGRDGPTLERARAGGAIDAFTTELDAGVAEADIVVVCTPVGRLADDAARACRAAPPRCVVTDAGSTKAGILASVTPRLVPGGAAFVGSHPLAGSEKRGAAHGRADLFEDRVVVVTPTPETDLEAVAVVEKFWHALGATTVRLDPEAHDRALAATSHLPHAAASALAAVTPLEVLGLTAGGFRDTTRVAAGDPELWAAIFETNRGPLLGRARRLRGATGAAARGTGGRRRRGGAGVARGREARARRAGERGVTRSGR